MIFFLCFGHPCLEQVESNENVGGNRENVEETRKNVEGNLEENPFFTRDDKLSPDVELKEVSVDVKLEVKEETIDVLVNSKVKCIFYGVFV